jgi:hypothetical protein
MELFLNIVWVLIALASLVVWRVFWKRQERPAPGKPLWEWTALVYALVLLFFPISMSDDLRCDLLLFDVCSIGRRQAGLSIHAAPPQPGVRIIPAPGLVALSRLARFEPRRIVAVLTVWKPCFLSLFSGTPQFGRAPPA